MAQIDITKQGRNAFAAALVKAEIGDEILYHIGEFAAGEHKHVALASHGAGICVLYQRRFGERQFAYIAKKIKGPKK